VAEVEIREAREEDLEPVYEIVADQRRRIFGGVEGFELEHMQNLWRRLRGNWVAVSGPEIVGAAAIVTHGVEVDVRPEARRRGIGTRLLQVAEGSTDLEELRADAVTLEPAGAAFLRANGYEKTFEYWLMSIEVSGEVAAPTWPNGVSLRTFREDDAQGLWSLLETAYAAEPDPFPQFEDWRGFMLEDPSFEPENWFLAEAGDELVGAAVNWNDAYVKDLVVHPGWRRRGLGEALMRHTLRHFGARGHSRVTLKTDSTNPTQAWRLYERLGMRKERTYEVFQKEL
jgi:mycothiol synthase